MIFQSYEFIAFFAVTALVCLAAARCRLWLGQLLLMAASMVFVIWSGLPGFLVLCAGTVVTALALQRLAGDGVHRRCWLLLACGYHVAVLMVFKYTGFLTGGAVSVGWVPIGLSFFTFQQLWLLKEAYTREYVPEQGHDLILYALFFPTVASGPILRPNAFFPQLKGEKFLRPDWQDAAAGLYCIVLGCAKKVLLADAFGILVTNGFTHPERLTTIDGAMVVLGYTLQLYFDFSGYCDMAAGLARILGIRLPINFDSPYRALSVGEFWKRWHITLTTFLRECIYFPLGGSKKGTVRTYLNIMIIFLISGIWHGAGWTFILWGALHGLAQVAERLLGKRRDALPKWLQWGLTFGFVNVAWVFFRAPSVSAALTVLKSLLSFRFVKPQPWLAEGIFTPEMEAVRILLPVLAPYRTVLLIAALFIIGMAIVLWPKNNIRSMDEFKPAAWRAAVLCILALWSVLSFSSITQFIYSNF